MSTNDNPQTKTLRLFLCGDVMTGRGIDQALPHPVDPVLYEPYVRDAGEYVELAEKAHGAFQRPVTFDYIWGETVQELDRADVDLRIINLETAITSAETQWPGKGIHYRMHPLNIGCLSAARINGCALANNHVLDWGYEGLFGGAWMRRAWPMRARGAMRKRQQLPPCSMFRAKVECFSSRLDRQAAGFRGSGMPAPCARA